MKILASADSQQKSDIREALKLLGQFQQQQGDNARADAELVLKKSGTGPCAAHGHQQHPAKINSATTTAVINP